MDEHTRVAGHLEMDEETRARYEAWKRKRIRKRVIFPGIGILCVITLLIFVIVSRSSGESVERMDVVKSAVEFDFTPKLAGFVYLFNAHPLEMIGSTYDDQFVGEMSIVEASHVLAGHLESHGILTLVEERCVNAKLDENGWDYEMSYYAASYFVRDVIERYPNLDFFVDLHRDGVAHGDATAEIDGVLYAQVLFVIGTDNPVGYSASYAVAMELHHMLEERRPGISRGVFLSGGEGRDGIYSQDVSPMVQVIELGTVSSTVEEVNRTVEVLAEVLAEYVLLINERD